MASDQHSFQVWLSIPWPLQGWADLCGNSVNEPRCPERCEKLAAWMLHDYGWSIMSTLSAMTCWYPSLHSCYCSDYRNCAWNMMLWYVWTQEWSWDWIFCDRSYSIRLTKAFPSIFLCSSAKRMGKGIKVQVVNCHSGLGCQWVHVGPLRYHQLEVLMLVLANWG